MGYTTDFVGSVTVEPALSDEQVQAINEHSEKRHQESPWDGPNPGIWCDWVASDDGVEISWNGNEKFYNSPEWMKVIIKKFCKGHKVNGTINAYGEDSTDVWKLIVEDNVVKVSEASVTFEDPQKI